MTDTLNIWFSTKENPNLSNLAPRPFSWGHGTDKEFGIPYVSVEHAYQTWKSGKFNANAYALEGGKVRGKPNTYNDWNIALMKCIMLISFSQNKDALIELLATGDKVFTHNQARGIWKEVFPRLLTEVRSELAKEREETLTTHSVPLAPCERGTEVRSNNDNSVTKNNKRSKETMIDENNIYDAVQLKGFKPMKVLVVGSPDLGDVKDGAGKVWSSIERLLGLLPIDCEIIHNNTMGCARMVNYCASKFDDLKIKAVPIARNRSTAVQENNKFLFGLEPDAVIYFSSQDPLVNGVKDIIELAQSEYEVPVFSGNSLLDQTDLPYRYKEAFFPKERRESSPQFDLEKFNAKKHGKVVA